MEVSMKRHHSPILLIPVVLLAVAAGLFSIKSTTRKRDMLQELCALRPESERKHYIDFIQSCAEKNIFYGDCVNQFIDFKKNAAILALQKEWNLDEKDVQDLSVRTNNMLSYMRALEGGGIQISLSSWRGAKKLRAKKIETDALCTMLESILHENGVNNLKLELVIDSNIQYPIVYFHDVQSDNPDIPHFFLQLPEGFDATSTDFKRGNLEHELMHVARGHSIFVHDLSLYLSNRDHVSRKQVVCSQSIAKLMRACEYEADLLPSLKHPQIAHNVLLALESVHTIDESHPPTRKRKKMVSRVMRLGQYSFSTT